MSAAATPVPTNPSGPTLGAEDRARSRNRRATYTSLANLAAKLVTVGTAFATIPMTLHHLGSERFGLWMTISSLTALLAFADLGLGNGLLNAISEANGREDRAAMRRAIGNALAMLLLMAAALLVVLGVPLATADLAGLFGLSDPSARAELRPSLAVFLACFLLSLVAGVIQRTLIGLQMGFVNGMVAAAGSLLGLGFVLVAIAQGAGLPWLVAGLLGGPVLATAAAGVWLFLRRAPDLLPRAADVDRPGMAHLARMGAVFFVLQLATALAYASDNLIGARLEGAAAVGEFTIAARLFSIVTIGVAMYLGPLWPAYGEAIARGDVAWVRRTLVRSTFIAAGFALVASAVLVVGFGPITSLWLQRTVDVPAPLLWGLACWAVVNALGSGVAMFFNGAHVVWQQACIAVAFAGACLLAKLLATPHFGLQALPWSTAATYAVLVLVPYAALMPGIVRRLGAAGGGAP